MRLSAKSFAIQRFLALQISNIAKVICISTRSPRRLTLATLFGAVIFISKMVLPSPIDKAFVVVQALLLSLGYLLLGAPGATYISLIGGLLIAFWRAHLAPFTIAFALLYGLSIDALSSVLKARGVEGNVRQKNLIAAVTISTIIVGLASYFSAVVFELLPRNPLIEMSILISGVISGVIGGYFSIVIWKKILERSDTRMC